MKTITLRQLCSPCSPDYKHIYRESITINLILAYRFYNLIVHCQMNCDELDRRDSTNRWAHQCFFHGLYGEYCEWTTYTIILHHITLIFFRIFIYQWAINIYIYMVRLYPIEVKYHDLFMAWFMGNSWHCVTGTLSGIQRDSTDPWLTITIQGFY